MFMMTQHEKYIKWHSSPIAKKRRADRNTARRRAIKKYGKQALKGKDVDHKHTSAGKADLSNSDKNLRIVSVKYNRGRNNNSWRKTKKRNS
jgi:hypothetical protein